jgi:hypothetical protein
MQECVCVQCRDDEPGCSPEFWQCDTCRLWGSDDEYENCSPTCKSCVAPLENLAGEAEAILD